MNDKAQVSLEYLLLFFAVIIILSVISLPLLYDSIETTQDILLVVETKNTLNHLSDEIKVVHTDYYTQKTASVYIPENMKLEYRTSSGKHYLSANIKLSDNTTKTVKQEVPCKISFRNNPSYYYNNLNKRWYNNVEIKWLKANDNTTSIDLYFK